MTSLIVGDLNAPDPGLYSPVNFPSTKGGLKVVYMGYSYVKDTLLNNGNITFKCDYPNRECNRRLTINSTGTTCGTHQPHNIHAPDQAVVEVKWFFMTLFDF